MDSRKYSLDYEDLMCPATNFFGEGFHLTSIIRENKVRSDRKGRTDSVRESHGKVRKTRLLDSEQEYDRAGRS